MRNPPEPVLRLRLQRGRGPDRRRGALSVLRRPAFADHRRGGDGASVRKRGGKFPAVAASLLVNCAGSHCANLRWRFPLSLKIASTGVAQHSIDSAAPAAPVHMSSLFWSNGQFVRAEARFPGVWMKTGLFQLYGFELRG